GPWFLHPYCLALLRRAVDDTTPTGIHYAIDETTLRCTEHGKPVVCTLPKFLADPKIRRKEADERVCDQAAARLGDLVLGLPLVHPLYKDADQRLADLKATFDRYSACYQRSDPYYVAKWMTGRLSSNDVVQPVYLPVLRPLERAATAKDVADGKAI